MNFVRQIINNILVMILITIANALIDSYFNGISLNLIATFTDLRTILTIIFTAVGFAVHDKWWS